MDMNHIDNDNMDIIIARYFGGDATPDEIDRLRKWIELSSENKKLFFEQQDLYDPEAALHAFGFSPLDVQAGSYLRAEGPSAGRTSLCGRRGSGGLSPDFL